jgi:hypothetical protein
VQIVRILKEHSILINNNFPSIAMYRNPDFEIWDKHLHDTLSQILVLETNRQTFSKLLQTSGSISTELNVANVAILIAHTQMQSVPSRRRLEQRSPQINYLN